MKKNIKYVINYESKQGRKPQDVSKKRVGYDIKSGDRYIEVKSRPGSRLQPFLTLHNHLLRSIGKGLAHYYIYVIYDMKKDPKLVILPPELVLRNLETNVSLFIRRRVYNRIKPLKLKV